MQNGWIKIATVTPPVRVADVEYNVKQIITLSKEAATVGAKLIVFPELCITGYTCGDLFLQQLLLDRAEEGLWEIVKETQTTGAIIIVGLPLRDKSTLYNVAAICYNGEVLGFVPKKNIPNHGEFYELRHFTAGRECDGSTVTLTHDKKEITIPIGVGMIFSCREMNTFTFGVEICEDVWVPNTSSTTMAQRGATIICNLSCSDEIIGKDDYRQTILAAKSGSLICAYAYADAGVGESTQDMVFAGHNLIYENGVCLAQSTLFSRGILSTEVDVDRLTQERRRMSTFTSEPIPIGGCIPFSMKKEPTTLTRPIPQYPFVPTGENNLATRCEKILLLQSQGLAHRLEHINCQKAVIGLSGGLDSTLALIVVTHAFILCGYDPKGIIAVTMPCFGTTDRTYQNACQLAVAYGATLREVPIAQSVRQHFHDIKHDESIHDITYENAQARERTQVLMDLANQCGGIVIGTGDLSELALGWATYNGDHMSMYAVNATVPKTLVRYLVEYEASHVEMTLSTILHDILDTPVSPELLPPEDDGSIAQKTEELVGPYTLHDFFLYYILRYGFSPQKIDSLATIAFDGVYTKENIHKWMRNFYRRFFSEQF